MSWEGIGVSKTCLGRANEGQSAPDARPVRQGHEALRRAGGAARDRPRRRGGRVPRAARPVRVRQDDAAAATGGAGDGGRGPPLDRRARGHLAPARGARRGHGVPELRALPAHDGVREHRVPAARPSRGPGGDRSPRPQGGGASRARAPARPPSRPALGWPAAAGRPRPRDRARARGLPDGRAAVQPGRPAARADAGRAQAPAAGAGHDHALRHARPGRGHDAGAARGPAARGRRSSRWRRRSISTAIRPRASRPRSWAAPP